MKLSKIKPNPDNPRVLRDERFEKLKKSIQEFPKMMELRPIVVDDKGIILGGNMRYRALQDLGYTEVPDGWVKRADELTEEEKQRFIIADNVGLGEWDFEALANGWDMEQLEDWGLEILKWGKGHDINNEMSEDDLCENEDFDVIGASSGLQRVVFLFDGKDEAESYLKSIGVEVAKQGQAWQVNLSTQSI